MIDPGQLKDSTIAVVGLGYVGLPLALAFGAELDTIGFDIDAGKIEKYRRGIDPNREIGAEEFEPAKRLEFTSEAERLREADIVIIAVPTPIDEAKQPDLRYVTGASRIVGQNLKSGALVVYESTVYPGVTEEVCGPILAKESGLEPGRGFKLGYSPERFNPGDKAHTLRRIVKVVSGEDAETLELVARLYELIVEAGVHRAESIKVAEAAKVIENTQRDLNIALMNELAIIFNKLGLDTEQVLKAAETKWNFLPFRPGLVGGHCIGVDPYYLTYKAELLDYQPQVILAGRRINDGMGKYIAEQTIHSMLDNGSTIRGSTCLIMGLTFKENVNDLRNSRVIDILRELESFGVNVLVWDPVADPTDALNEYGISLTRLDDLPTLDAVVAAVAHAEICAMDIGLLASRKARDRLPFIDVKSAFDKDALYEKGLSVWRL